MKKVIKNLRKNWITYGFETLVVIVGILVAFALNNWTEERKSEKEELQFLNRLLEDLSKDTSYYSTRINESEDAILHLKRFIDGMYDTQHSREDVGTLFEDLRLNTDHLTTHNSTYRELMSAGKLNIFNNQELKSSIINYYRLNEEYAIHIEEYNLVSTNSLDKLLRNVMKYTLDHPLYQGEKFFEPDEWNFINDPNSIAFRSLESVAATYWHRNTEQLEYFQELTDSASKLLVEIQSEVASK